MMSTLDLESLTLKELEDIQAKIKDIITVKKADSQPKLVVYTHKCQDASDYHKGKYKHWAKLVKAVDTTKTNGYAFVGDFLNINYEHKVPVGSIVVEVCQMTLTAYKATTEGMKEIGNARTNTMSDLIEEIAKLM